MIGHSWEHIEANVTWKQWSPGIDAVADMQLGEVLATLPASDASDIPWIVRLFENPNPPISFPELFPLPGAISLERHDAIHCLLGRGLLPQDEAFVLGYTMGSTKGCANWQYSLFKFASKYLYPKYYKFGDTCQIALDLGFQKGRESIASDLGHFPFERFKDFTIDELRNRLGISREKLYAIYSIEKILIPDSVESRRLDFERKTAPSYIQSKGEKL